MESLNRMKNRDLMGERNTLVKSTYVVTNSIEKSVDFRVGTDGTCYVLELGFLTSILLFNFLLCRF